MAWSGGAGTRNVYEHVLVGKYEDQITGTLQTVRKKAEDQMNGIERSTNSVAGAFNSVKLAAKTMVGVMALTGLRGVWSDLVEYAKTTSGQAGIMARRYDAAGETIKKIVVDSKAFTDLVTYAARAAEGLAAGLGAALGWMDKLNLSASDFLGPFLGTIAKVSDFFQSGADSSTSFWSKQRDKVDEVSEAWSKGIQIFEDYRIEQEKTAKAFQDSWIGYGASGQGDSTVAALDAQADAVRAIREELAAIQSMAPKAREPIFPTPADDSIEALASYNDRLRDTLYLMHRLAYEEGGRLSDLLGAMAQELPTKFEIAREAIEGFRNAGVAGMQAFGAALVQGRNALKAFLGAFLQTIAQMAVQFGSMIMLYGIVGQVVPFLGISGGAAIAAGAALVAFGGALGAIAQGLQSRGGGRTVSSGATAGFTDRPEGSGSGGSVYNVTFNFSSLDPGQVDEGVMRDMARRFMYYIDRENNLSTNITYTGG